MEVTKFEIKTKNGFTVKGEYEGNLQSKNIIIFSHGFGVTRDSHGMFTDISKPLIDNFLLIRFDYTIVNKEENWTRVFSYNVQAEMLEAVYEYATNTFSPQTIDIIAHPMGCLITGIADLGELNTVILLAGPPVAPYERMKEYFAKRPETVIDETSLSTIKRSDGSITYVEHDFWNEMKIVNPPMLYEKISKKANTTFVRALSGQVITESNYDRIKNITNLKYIELNGNHDFEGQDRQGLLKLVTETITEEQVVIVNDQDTVIGSRPRSWVKDDDIFRVSSLFLYDENKRVLLGKRASTKKNNPGKWSPIVNGTNAIGETYESNILKEINEEINVKVSDLMLVKIVRVTEKHDHFVAFFSASISSKTTINFDKNEISEVRWYTKEELQSQLNADSGAFVPGFQENIFPFMW